MLPQKKNTDDDDIIIVIIVFIMIIIIINIINNNININKTLTILMTSLKKNESGYFAISLFNI